MAAKGTIGAKIVLEGEKEYRKALKEIKADQAELRSEMKLCQTEYKNSQNSLEALKKKHEILTKQIDTQTQKVQLHQKAMETSAQKEELAAKKVEELQTALDKATAEFNEMQSSSDTTKEALDAQGKTVDDLKQKLNRATENYDKATQKTQSYQTSVNYAQAELKNMEVELQNTEKYMQEAEKSTDGCAKSIDEYGKETKEASQDTTTFGNVLKANLASEAIIQGVKMLAQGIKECAESAVEVGTEFESAMSQVAATMGMTAEEINNGSEDYNKLAQAAKDCGKATKYSASEAGEALNYLALAGYDADKAVETLPKVLDLAAAGGMDLAYASDLVTDAMSALGMETSDLDKYIDEMAKTSQKSNTNVAQLGEATLVCAGTVSLTSQSLETMNAELGILANNGIKGAEGGTHLRNILLSLAAPTETASIAINDLRLNIKDSEGNMRDLNDIMIDMNASMSDLSDVEKTKLINQIFNKTDIAAVNALLKGTNGEYDKLVEELNNSAGAAKNMADTMNNNLKGKVTILKSALEGLGIAAYEVFDDDMKMAVDGATDAVGRLQTSIEKGDLGVSLNKMSDALGDFCESAIDAAEDILPKMIDGLTWVIDNADVVISGIVGFTAATKGAEAVQWLLNAAMDANPAAILAKTIIALTAGVASYVLINKDNLIQQSEEVAKTKELVEETKKLNDEYSKSAGEREKTKGDIQEQTTTISRLTTELGELRSKTNLTAQEQSRMKMVVAELNELVPDLTLEYDEQSNTFNKTQKEIEGCVDAYISLYKAQAAQEELQEIAQQQIEYEKQLYEIEQQRGALQDELTAAQDKYNAVMEEAKETYGEMTELYGTAGTAEYNAVMQAQSALDALNDTQKETEESNAQLAEEYEYWMGVVSDNQAISDAAAATGELGDAASNAGSATVEMSEQVKKAYQDLYDDIAENVQNQISLFSQFKSETDLTTTQLLDNMQSQVDGISKWADNLEELGERGINQGLLSHLAEMGPEGAAYAQLFVSMTEEELEKAGELYEEAAMLPDETASRITDSWLTAGENAVQGYVDGIDGKKESVQESAKNMGEESLKALEEALDEHSPSKETEEAGKNFDVGMENGIEGESQALIDVVSKMAARILQTVNHDINRDNGAEIGRQMVTGIAEGIKSGESQAINAAAEMAKKTLAAAKKELGVQSQSYSGREIQVQELRQSMANINAVVHAAMPETSMPESYFKNTPQSVTSGGMDVSKKYEVNQQINIYAQTNDLVETSREFKRAQKEAAEVW